MSASAILCRMCAKIVYNARNIYDNDYDNVQYISKFKQLFSDIVFEDDYNLPQHICSNCCTKLEDAFDFKKQCISSVEYLKKCNRNFQERTAENSNFEHVDIKQEVGWNEKLIENNSENIECDTSTDFLIPRNCTKYEKVKNCQKHRNKFAEIQKDDNKSVTTGASSTSVNSEVHKIEDKNVKVRVQESEEFYTCSVCQTNFRSHSDLETHVTVHLKHFDENDTVIRFSEIIIKEEKIEIKEETAESNEETISAEDQSITQVLEMKTKNTNPRVEDTKEGKNIVDFTEKQVVHENIKKRDLAEKNTKEMTSTGYLCAEEYESSCTICHRGIFFLRKYVKHLEKSVMKVHEKRDTQNSETCNHDLDVHTTIHRGIKPYSCNECHAKCKHMIAHSGVKQYSCNECSKEFTRKSALERHMNIYCGVKPYSCNDCNKKFTQKSRLERHMNVHSDLKPYSCNECQKKFREKSKLRQHVNGVHRNMKQYSCNECGKKFSWKPSLQRHMNVHSVVKPYSCNDCHKKFSQKSDLERHMNVHRDVKPYSCNECHKKFSQNSDLIQHMNVHGGVKPYSCNYCHKKFTQKCRMERHMNVHNDLKPYSCNECQKKFRDKSNLRQHVNCVHRNMKQYSCNECGKKFNWKPSLQRHMNVHSGVKPYSCNDCHKKFSQKSDLERHMNVHRGVKPYSCNECHKIFSQKSDLERPMNVLSVEKPYSCNECQKNQLLKPFETTF